MCPLAKPRVSVWRELHLLSRDARYPTFSCLFALTDSGCALFSQRDQDAHSSQSLVLHFSLVDRSYVYYFFNFLSMNRLAECIKKGNFYIPERHIDKLNEAYDRSSGCVYIFVSSQNEIDSDIVIAEYIFVLILNFSCHCA